VEPGLVRREDVEKQLERILASKLFRGSDRSQIGGKRPRAKLRSADVLAYLVRGELEGRGDGLSEVSIQIDVFKREEFDKVDAIVRVHMRRLRELLAEYYVTEGVEDPVSIDIPLGSHRPVFAYRDPDPPDKEVLQGFHLINLEAPANIARALALFKKAIELNSENAEAHAGMAMALCTLTLHDITASPAELLPKAEAEALKAIGHDPNSWLAHAALGGIHAFRREWVRADEEFQKALAIDREGTRDHGAYGLYLLGRGDYKAARELARRDEKLRPDKPTFLKRAALFLYALRGYSEAERILTELFPLHENLWHAHTLAALICLETGRPQEALSHMREINSRKDPDLWPGLHVLCLARSGHQEEARRRFDKLLQATMSGYVEPLQIALGYIAFGEPLLAIEWLAKGAEIGDIHMLWLHLWPFLDPLREHPRFKDLLRRTGLPRPPGS
jgi:tetratricopeptide (TPR) repeat protein